MSFFPSVSLSSFFFFFFFLPLPSASSVDSEIAIRGASGTYYVEAPVVSICTILYICDERRDMAYQPNLHSKKKKEKEKQGNKRFVYILEYY